MFFSLILFPLMGSVRSESYPDVLSKEDEKKHLDLMKEGSKESRDILINHNLRLVAHIVKKFENSKEERDDLLSTGIMGLMKAVDSYKHPCDTKLATYAARCIENEILMLFRANKKRNNDISINTPLGTDKEGNEITIIDTLHDPKEDVEEKTYLLNNISKLNQIIHILNERELEVICKRYGILNTKVETQKVIAKRMNISRSYVSRIEKRAISKLYLKFRELEDI